MKPREAAIAAVYIRRRKPATGVTRSDSERGVVACSIGVERQHAIAEQLEQAVECARQGVPAPARRQQGAPDRMSRLSTKLTAMPSLITMPHPTGDTMPMSSITIRNLDPAVKERLRVRA